MTWQGKDEIGMLGASFNRMRRSLQGYAPIEQYAETPNMKQGAWTDLYALASVVYFAVTGQAPEPAVARVISDPVVPLFEAAAGRYSETFLSAIDAAMSVKPEERPQNIAEFRDALGFGPLQTHPALREHGADAIVSPGTAARANAEAVPFPDAVRSSLTAPQVVPRTDGAPPHTSDAELAQVAGIERLLAQYIGPLAKIIVSRARKNAGEGEALVQRAAESIDDEKDRTAFVAAARKLMSGRQQFQAIR